MNEDEKEMAMTPEAQQRLESREARSAHLKSEIGQKQLRAKRATAKRARQARKKNARNGR